MSLVEHLTRQFSAWEQRGRGWSVWDEPVDLEPPFLPFQPTLPSSDGAPVIDDGRKPTALSAMADGLRGLFARKAPRSPSLDEPDPDEFPFPEPEPSLDLSPAAETQLAVPQDLLVTPEAAEQWLLASGRPGSPAAFELIGTEAAITIQLAARGADAQTAARLAAYFPEIVGRREDGRLARAWRGALGPAAVVDFGLSRETMLPLRTYWNFNVDPLLGFLAALGSLGPGEVGVVQVLFQPVAGSWGEGLRRAVVGADGEPFLLDAPREFTTLTERKCGRPLFAVVLRVGARAPGDERAWEIARSLGLGIRIVADPAGNELIPLANDGYPDDAHEYDLLDRVSRRSGMILSSEELAMLVHPPSSSVVIEQLERWVRKTKAAPKIAHGNRLVLGRNVHGANETLVTVSPEQRSRHMHLIGASGTGKSTLLLTMTLQDLANGDGVGVLDPHGDLVEAVLARIPPERLDDVVLFDPSDADWPVGFNILSAHTELEKTLLSSDLVAIFRRMSETWGDQMNAVFANAIAAFLESPRGGTLQDLRRFLVDPAFRTGILATVTDPDIAYYWQKEFPLLSGRPQSPILSRLDGFLRPKLIRNMVAQRDDRLDFAEIMNRGRIFLAKLAQGTIGEENAHLLGTFLVARLQQTAMGRQEMAAAERRPFYLYIDEFQHFITPSMAQILSGARKYRLGLVLAHQDLQQVAGQDADVLSSVISNCHTRVCFRVGEQDAKALVKGFGSFEAQDLQNLGIGQAIARIERAEYDFNLDTPMLADVDSDNAAATRHEAVSRSRARYARSREEVERLARPVAAPVPSEVPTEPQEEVVQPEPKKVAAEAKRPKKAKEAPAAPTPTAAAPSLTLVPTTGRGGAQHRYLQELFKRWAEAHDWRAAVEEAILDGLGNVDVALRKGDRSVACEIAVTTAPDHEVGNIKKCLAAGFGHVLVVSPEKKTLNAVRQRAAREFAEEELARVRFGSPEEAFTELEGIEAEAAGGTATVRGYTVKVKYRAIAEQEKTAKRQAVSGVIARAMKRMKGD